VPDSSTDWKSLLTTVSLTQNVGSINIGAALKAFATSSTNSDGKDLFGFTALPFVSSGSTIYPALWTNWWTSSQFPSSKIDVYQMGVSTAWNGGGISSGTKTSQYSLRCLKD
jgi:uncharacterized protein (TIGR02145 family)